MRRPLLFGAAEAQIVEHEFRLQAGADAVAHKGGIVARVGLNLPMRRCKTYCCQLPRQR